VSGYEDYIGEDQRLAILRFLHEAPSYRANASTVQDALRNFGHTITRDQVLGHLQWMQEQGLVTAQEAGPAVLVATLTNRGGDVATGAVKHPGVKRPAPGRT